MAEDVRIYPWLYAPELVPEGKVSISGEGLRHLKTLRVKTGDKICFFDGKGKVAVCEVLDEEHVNVLTVHETPKSEYPLHIAVSVPKGERADWMLQKLAELGVMTIIPLRAERSVVLPRGHKQERWQNILIEACKQSKNPWLPELRELSTINEALKQQADAVLLLDPAGVPVREILQHPSRSVLAFIGPEGGFTEQEKAGITGKNARVVSLGRNVLRVETAAITLAAVFTAATQQR